MSSYGLYRYYGTKVIAGEIKKIAEDQDTIDGTASLVRTITNDQQLIAGIEQQLSSIVKELCNRQDIQEQVVSLARRSLSNLIDKQLTDKLEAKVVELLHRPVVIEQAAKQISVIIKQSDLQTTVINCCLIISFFAIATSLVIREIVKNENLKLN